MEELINSQTNNKKGPPKRALCFAENCDYCHDAGCLPVGKPVTFTRSISAITMVILVIRLSPLRTGGFNMTVTSYTRIQI